MTETSTPKNASPRQPGLEDVKQWIGYRVDEISGHSVAKVDGVFVDQEIRRARLDPGQARTFRQGRADLHPRVRHGRRPGLGPA